MKYLTLLALLALTACGGGGGTPVPKIFNGDGANAVGCTTEVVNGVLPGINVDCGAGPVFIPFGVDGAKGDTGVAGTNGTNGSNGTDGQDGIDGADGVSCTFEAQPDQNRIAIDCNGNIIYVPTGANIQTNSAGNTVEVILINGTGAVVTGLSNNYVKDAITTIYSPNARFVTVTSDADLNIISEIFRLREDDPTLGAPIYAQNYFDEDGEYHHNTQPALVWDNLNSSSQQNKEIWYKHGIEHREDDNGPSSTITTGYVNNPTTSDKFWKKDGELHREGDLPARDSFGSNQSITKAYYINGIQNRIFGPAYYNHSGSYSSRTYHREWLVDGVRYKYHYHSGYHNTDTYDYGEFANSTEAQTAFLAAAISQGATATEASLAWNATE